MANNEINNFLKIPKLAKYVLIVASGKGGVGKSTFALNLAFTFQYFKLKVGLLDADIYGPSLTKLLNTNQRPKIKNKNFLPLEVNGLKTMSIGYLVPEETANIWRGPMVIKAVTQLLRDVAWGELDVLIIDTPPGTGDVQLTISQKIDVTGALIITTPQDLSLLDVKRGINMFKKVNLPILGIVENMSYYICNDCQKKHYIFGKKSHYDLTKNFGVEVLGELPISENLIKNHDVDHPIIKQKQSDFIFKSFFDISQKIIDKIKV
tara:strand:+ start:171 stop:962 length:792 start_codon:yes stop_codon:yes gene_type:complete